MGKKKRKKRANQEKVMRQLQWVLILANGLVSGSTLIYICFVCSKSMDSLFMKDVIVAAVVSFTCLILVDFVLSELVLGRVRNNVNSLRSRAQFDQLTQIYNKKTFEDMVGERLEDCEPTDMMAFFMLDVDYFKNINDKLGHKKGDQVLAEVAEKIRGIFRFSDLYGRLGGDEFGIFISCNGILLDVDEFLERKAKRLHDDMRKIVLELEDQPNVTLSIGAVKYEMGMNGFAELYEKADEALYVSKVNGRDRFIIYGKNVEEEIDGAE